MDGKLGHASYGNWLAIERLLRCPRALQDLTWPDMEEINFKITQDALYIFAKEVGWLDHE